MNEIGQLRFISSAPAPSVRDHRPADREALAPRFDARPELDSVHLLDPVPPAPPADVLAEIEHAKARAAEIIAAGRELHFARDEASGRIVVEVRDASGNVLRTIPPSRALAVMSGEAGLD